MTLIVFAKSTILACWLQMGKKIMMQLTFIAVLITAGISPLSAYVDAQSITLSEKEAPLEKVLEKIKQQCGYSFWYNDELMQTAKPVTVKANNVSLEDVLKMIFKDQPLTYQLMDKMVVLRRIEKKSPANILTQLFSTAQGVVTDEGGKPLSGVSVLVKGTNTGTQTNTQGEFSLTNLPRNAVLIFSIVGYETIAVPAGTEIMRIRLQVRIGQLDEMQVIAYGTTTRRLNTGNVATVKAEDIEKQPVNNPLLALQGRMTGIVISQSTGLPGTGVRIVIRGRNSISNGYTPLFIVDGVPYSSDNVSSPISNILGFSNDTQGNPFSFLNPADIESIDVLKDADATAIYGSRGANGVILITTKKGRAGQMLVDVNAQHGFGQVARKMEVLNRRQYLDMRYEAFRNDGKSPDPNADYDLTLWDTTRSTDWQEELIGGTAKYTDIQASVSGGNDQTQYRIAGGYHKETTVFPGDFNDRKGSMSFNLNSSSADRKFKIGLSGNYMQDENRLLNYDLTQQAIALPPIAPPMYTADGNVNWAPNASGVGTWPYGHPGAMLKSRIRSNTKNLVSNIRLSYEFFDGLSLSTSMGYTQTQVDEIHPIPRTATDPSKWATVPRQTTFADNSISSWLVEPQLSYTGRIGRGDLAVLLGATIQESQTRGRSLTAKGFNSDLLLEDISAATNITVLLNEQSHYKYGAVFGKLNYNVDNTYLLNLSVRRDGTSRFGPANRFHNFGAIGAGWIFSKESFIQGAVSFLSFGKLRASFGTTGSDQVGDYTYFDLYDPIAVGVPYQGVIGSAPTRIFTPDLAWEQTRKLEMGLELGFLNDRIFFSVSRYRNRSSNQLLNYNLPSITGFTSTNRNLDALVQNQGWEFELRTSNVNNKDFKWSSSVNLSMNRNKLVSGSAALSDDIKSRIGYPLGVQFVYKFLGVNPVNGLYQVADYTGKPTANPDPATDRTVMLDFTTKFYGGFENSFSWKGIELDILFQFSRRPLVPIYLYNYIPGFFDNSTGSNQPVSVLERWRQPGDVSTIQRFSQSTGVVTTINNARQSDQAYGDGSYIRLKNVSLSWQLPGQWQQRLHLRNARLYIHGQNILTITDYQGLDPETGSFNTLPPLRVFTIGLQVSLSGATRK